MSSIPDWDRKRTIEAMFANVPAHIRDTYLAQREAEKDQMDKDADAEAADDKEREDQDKRDAANDVFLIQAPEDPFAHKEARPGAVQDSFKEDVDNAALTFVTSIVPSLKGSGVSLEDAIIDYAEGADVPPEDLYEKVYLLLKKKGINPASVGESRRSRLGRKLRESFTTGSLGLVSPQPMLVTTSPSLPLDVDVPEVPSTFSAVTSSGTNNGHTHLAYYDAAGNGETSVDDGHKHSVRSFMVDDYQTSDGGLKHSHPGALPNYGDVTVGSVPPSLGVYGAFESLSKT